MFTDSPWKGIEGIVLDAVGTLIHPEPSVASVYRAAAERQGVSLAASVVKKRFSRFFRDDEHDEIRGPMVTDEAIERCRWKRIVGDVLPEVPDPERAFGELWSHFARAESWRVFDDVAPALEALSASGLNIVIASNFDARLRGIVVGLGVLNPHRESLVISSEVGFRKPHEKFYEAARETLGLPSARILCAGDDLENDVLGARRAGLRSVLIDRHGKYPAEPNVFPDLEKLTAGLDSRDGLSAASTRESS